MLKEMHFFCWYLQLSGNHEKQDGVCNEIQRTKAWPCIQDKGSKEMNRKWEQEFQETLAAMQRRFVELKGRIFFLFLSESQGSKWNSRHCFWI